MAVPRAIIRLRKVGDDLDICIRQAAEQDKRGISRTIAYSFEKEFSMLIKDMERVAKAFEDSIDVSRFFVAEQNGEVVGMIACTDCTGRAVEVNRKAFVSHWGFFRGMIGYTILKPEFMSPLQYPSTTGYIEFVGVLKQARGKGLAKTMLKEIIERHPQYDEFFLDVTDVNIPAQKSYQAFGFVESHRVPEKHPKQRGFNSRIYMRYRTESTQETGEGGVS
jgi:ribosomal protein S18 acetylase RimI-like enzyme